MSGTTRFDSGVQVIYNPELIPEVPEWLFDPSRIAAPSTTRHLGRGSVRFFQHEGRDLVLRQYHRGGFARHFVTRTFLYTTLANTRMWREFKLLEHMLALGLPVPVPVACCCRKTSALTCTGALLTLEIQGANTLAEMLVKAPLAQTTWESVGRVIARFHNRDINHNDLNANNIMLAPQLAVHLIDFDKGRIQPALKPNWARSNLNRLLRSLHKLQLAAPVFHFKESDWASLMRGYTVATEVEPDLVRCESR